MNIYVGNMSFDIGEKELKTIFEDFGTVDSAKVIIDKFTGSSKGFGFVEMSDDEAARSAISELNGKEVKGRELSVNEARPRREFNDRGRDGGRGGKRW